MDACLQRKPTVPSREPRQRWKRRGPVWLLRQSWQDECRQVHVQGERRIQG